MPEFNSTLRIYRIWNSIIVISLHGIGTSWMNSGRYRSIRRFSCRILSPIQGRGLRFWTRGRREKNSRIRQRMRRVTPTPPTLRRSCIHWCQQGQDLSASQESISIRFLIWTIWSKCASRIWNRWVHRCSGWMRQRWGHKTKIHPTTTIAETRASSAQSLPWPTRWITQQHQRALAWLTCRKQQPQEEEQLSCRINQWLKNSPFWINH